MSSLAVFPPPSRQDNVTLSEYNSNLIIGDHRRGSNPTLYSLGQDYKYDKISATEDALKIPTNLARDISESPFLPVDESVTQKMYNIWSTEGLSGVLEELSETQSDGVPGAISSASRKLFTLWKWVEKTSAKLVVSQKLKDPLEVKLSGSTFLKCFDYMLHGASIYRISGPIQAFAWHPHLTKFAVGFKESMKTTCLRLVVFDAFLNSPNIPACLDQTIQTRKPSALELIYHLLILLFPKPDNSVRWKAFSSTCYLKDDSVRIFRVKRGLTKLLNHRYQKFVSCCAWRPLSASVLAVGCQNGVMVWKVDPQSSAIRQGAGSVQHLTRPGHSFITSISWSPGGRLLVSGSASSGIMMVWDVTMECGVALHRIGGAISHLTWSPCDTKIFVATESSLIRVWETQKWTCETWTNLASKCQAACWSPNGDFLVFSVAEEQSLYYLRFCEPVGNTGMEDFDIGGAKMAVKCADLTEYSWIVDGKTISIGGYVKSMAWDPTGERLAVILRDDEGISQNYIPVFKTTLNNVFELVPSGFIHGLPSDGEPQLISFQKNFKQGTLLSVVWSSGNISFIPMLFSPSSVIQNNNHSSQIFSNGHNHSMSGLYSNQLNSSVE